MPTHVGTSAIFEHHDVPKSVAKTPAIAVAHIIERSDRPKGIGKITITGVAHIHEARDIVRPIIVIVGHLRESGDSKSSNGSVTTTGTASVSEVRETVAYVSPVGAQASVSVATGRRFGLNTHQLTVNVDTEAGGSINQVIVVFNPNVDTRDKAVDVALAEMDRALNVYTVANSTFS